jgi:hypothetical protein
MLTMFIAVPALNTECQMSLMPTAPWCVALNGASKVGGPRNTVINLHDPNFGFVLQIAVSRENTSASTNGSEEQQLML